eukprot:2855440-Prymnesium_polylepis.3
MLDAQTAHHIPFARHTAPASIPHAHRPFPLVRRAGFSIYRAGRRRLLALPRVRRLLPCVVRDGWLLDRRSAHLMAHFVYPGWASGP